MVIKRNYNNDPLVGECITKDRELVEVSLYDNGEIFKFNTWEDFKTHLDRITNFNKTYADKEFKTMIYFWDVSLPVEFIKGIFPIAEENIMRKTADKAVIFRALYGLIEFRNLKALSGYDEKEDYIKDWGDGKEGLEGLYNCLIHERSKTTYDMLAYLPITPRKLLEKEIVKILNEYNGGPNRKWQRYMADTSKVYEFYMRSKLGNDVMCRNFAKSENYTVYSYDIKSSYPYEMITKEFPSGKATYVNENCEQKFELCLRRERLFIGHFVIKNAKLKVGAFPTLRLSKHCHIEAKSFKTLFEVGRVRQAISFECFLNSVDYKLLEKNYTYDKIEIIDFIYYKNKSKLPQPLIDEMIHLFQEKEKNRSDRRMYKQAKMTANSVPGLFNRVPTTYAGSLKYYYDFDHNHSYYVDFPYQIGYWTVAFARGSLHELVEVGTVYIDTDCVKTTTDLTEKVKELNKKRTVPGTNVGQWVNEYNGPVLFRSFGSKQYFIRTPDGKEEVRLSGARRETSLEYLQENYDDIFDIEFATIPKEYSGKVAADRGKDYKVFIQQSYSIGDVIDDDTLLKLQNKIEKEKSL